MSNGLSVDMFAEVKAALPAERLLEHCLGPPRFRRFLCPFHEDHRPSMTTKDGGIRCWSCGWKGDLFRFLENYLSIDRSGSLRVAADLAGVMLPGPESRPSRVQLLHRQICRENDRLSKQIDHDARRALTDGWRRIFAERHGDQARLWEMIDAACALERTLDVAAMV